MIGESAKRSRLDKLQTFQLRFEEKAATTQKAAFLFLHQWPVCNLDSLKIKYETCFWTNCYWGRLVCWTTKNKIWHHACSPKAQDCFTVGVKCLYLTFITRNPFIPCVYYIALSSSGHLETYNSWQINFIYFLQDKPCCILLTWQISR